MTINRHWTVRQGSLAAALAAALTAALLLWGTAAVALPMFSEPDPIDASPASNVVIWADEVFDFAGPNPEITEAVFSDTKYYTSVRIHEGALRVRVKNDANLSLLKPPPDSPFSTTVEVTMTNDFDETASGTLTLKTYYEYTPTDPENYDDWLALTDPGDPPEEYPAVAAPGSFNVDAGDLLELDAADVFDNAGTDPRFTGADFSTTRYYRNAGVVNGRLVVDVKTAEQLSGMVEPPDSPFTVRVSVEMSNDEYIDVVGELKFTTRYTWVEPAAPTLAEDFDIDTPPGALVGINVHSAFDDAGPNARFTGATFSHPQYLNTGEVRNDGVLWVEVKTEAELNALSPQPGSPFTFSAEVTMTNGRDQTASGTITFETTYDRQAPEDGADSEDPPEA